MDLSQNSVAEAIKISGATAVDVSSGVESLPEKRTPGKFMTLFGQPNWFKTMRRNAGNFDIKYRELLMSNTNLNTFRDQPDEAGRFGIHGGRFVAETLMPLILDVEKAYNKARVEKSFLSEMAYYQKHYIGRPSPLYFAERMTAHFGGAKLYLKRDELNHTGAHKINNVLGQALLAKRMGKTKIIAETGAGQHGVATATACALFRYGMRSLYGRRRC